MQCCCVLFRGKLAPGFSMLLLRRHNFISQVKLFISSVIILIVNYSGTLEMYP